MSSVKKAPLSGKVAIVTGATRNIGRGIALQLAENGAKVYITGRTLEYPQGSNKVGSLKDTAREIEARGGICVPVQCDHSKDADIAQLFETVKRENDDQLDILVNNAYSAVDTIFQGVAEEKTFWQQPPELFDEVNNVGLRNHYICAVYAARMMVPRKRGLIVNISSAGGLRYLFNPCYGLGKEACDRMAIDCGEELKKHNVAFISLWPGTVRTETVVKSIQESLKTAKDENKIKQAKETLEMFEHCETTEFPGKCIANLATDPDIMKMTAKIHLTADLGRKYNLKDAPGHVPQDITQLKTIHKLTGNTFLAAITPGFFRVPKCMLHLGGNKFY